MLKKRIIATAVAATGFVAAAVILPNAASASGSVCSAASCAASVDFASHGEHLTVHDNDSDGYSAVGQLQWKQAGWEGYETATVWNTNGLSGAAVKKDFNIPDGTVVKYRACRGHHPDLGSLVSCGGWHKDKA